jgi:Zn-dependent protease with chaperone function
MKKYLKLLSLLMLFISTAFSQQIDFNNYQILRSTGTLPIDLSDYVKEDLANANNTNKSKRSKKDEKDFILQSTSSLNKLLRSGVVIYNDPVGEYLTSILQKVLQANNIEEDIKVYFIRSEEANAYALDRNFIFFTAGLLAQVTSEAQIAMILSHEYVHHKNKHSRTEYVENKSRLRDYKSYKTTLTDLRVSMASFSRELETEADAQGFELFANTNYSYPGAVEAFEVLKYSYLPFEEIKYEKEFLESADLRFPDEYFLKELSPIVEKEDKNDDKYKTHPDIDKRIVDVQDLIEGKSNAGRQDFIISETDFYTYRKIARYELCRLYLIERSYEEAFYSAYILLKEEPNSIFLQKVILRSIYGISKHSNASKFSEIHISHKKKQGESQQVNYFFNSLTKREINLLGMHYAWNLHEKYKDDEDINYMLNDLVFEACKFNKLTPYSLKTEPRDTSTGLANDSIEIPKDTTVKKNNKYITVKGGGEKTNDNNKTKKKAASFIDYAFVTMLKNDGFKNLIKQQYQKWEEEEEAKEEALQNKGKKNKSKYADDQIDDTRNIENMLVLNPVILKMDSRKDENKIYHASVNKRKEMTANFVNLSSKAGITSTVLDPADLTENDADYLNDISILNTAMYEALNLPGKVTMLPTDNLDLKNLSEKYNTSYLANIGVFTYVEKKQGVALAVVMGVLSMGFLLPYTIYVLARPNVSTLVYMNVYDFEQHKFVFSDVNEVRAGGTQDVMTSTLYDMVTRMKKNKN